MAFFKYGEKETSFLKNQDTGLGSAIERVGPIQREVNPDLFSSLVRCIVGQQVSAKAAATVYLRLESRLGIITPEAVAKATIEEIQQCGLSTRKAGYIKGIGDAVAGGSLDLAALTALPDEEVIRGLSSLKGIGTWTAEMLLIFCLERPDVVSWGDLAIQRGMIRLYNLETLSREEFERYRRRYSPYGSVASLYLWEIAKD